MNVHTSMVAHYIIFHSERQKINANVKVLRNNLIYEENRDIYVDQINEGFSNEDPFVFSNPWLYSFCYATALKRVPNNIYVQPNSYLIFSDLEEAKKNQLLIDTIFLVDNVLVWPEKAKKPPIDYSYKKGDVWFRHIKHGIRPLTEKGHKGEYTYEAKMYKQYKDNFSFLPFSKGKRIKIMIKDNFLSSKIKTSMNTNSFHPPVILKKELDQILKTLNSNLTDKVVEIIGVNNNYRKNNNNPSCAQHRLKTSGLTC